MKTAWSRYLALVSGVSLLLVAGLALACECDDEGWELIPAWAQGKTTTTNWSDGPIYLCLDAADTTAHFRAVDGEGNDAPEIDWDTNPQGELEWQDHYKYTWHFGDGSDSVGRQVSHVYSAPGAYTVTLTTDDQAEHYDDDSLGVTDDITVYVIKVDLSATDLDGSVTEQNEEDPGAYVHYNIDNDNANTQGGNPIADKDEDGPVAGENDLKQATISLQPSLQVGTVVLKRSNTKARIWKSSTKGADNKVLVDADQKTWHLDNETERADFNNVKNTLWVEGYQDNDTVSVTTEYRDPSNNLICSDTVTYTFIGAVCGRQPTPAERTAMGNDYPNITHCEWSTTGEPTDDYNCIAWSVGITNEWIWLEVDTDFGDNDGILEVSDFDAFYDDEGYQTCAEAEAVIMPYKNPAKAVPKNPDGITHGARKRDCGSNNCGAGRWNMFESKLGDTERIEHRKAQLNGAAGAGYGAPFRYYKPK